MFEARSRPDILTNISRIRVGGFAGMEPNVFERGYAPDVKKYGVYLALDGERVRLAGAAVTVLRGSLLGCIFGPLPGTGALVSCSTCQIGWPRLIAVSISVVTVACPIPRGGVLAIRNSETSSVGVASSAFPSSPWALAF